MTIEGFGLSNQENRSANQIKSARLFVPGVGNVEIHDLTGKKNSEELLDLLASKSGYLQQLCQNLKECGSPINDSTQVSFVLTDKEELQVTLKDERSAVKLEDAIEREEKKLKQQREELTEFGELVDLELPHLDTVESIDRQLDNLKTQRAAISKITSIASPIRLSKPLTRQAEAPQSGHTVRWRDETFADRKLGDVKDKEHLQTESPAVFKERPVFKNRKVVRKGAALEQYEKQRAERPERVKSLWTSTKTKRKKGTEEVSVGAMDFKKAREMVAHKLKGQMTPAEASQERVGRFAALVEKLSELETFKPLDHSSDEVKAKYLELYNTWSQISSPEFGFTAQNYDYHGNLIQVYQELLDSYYTPLNALYILSENPNLKNLDVASIQDVQELNKIIHILEASNLGALEPCPEREFLDGIYGQCLARAIELGKSDENEQRKTCLSSLEPLERRGLKQAEDIEEMEIDKMSLEEMNEVEAILNELLAAYELVTSVKTPFFELLLQRYTQDSTPYFTKSYLDACRNKLADIQNKAS